MPYVSTLKLGEVIALAGEGKGWTIRDLERESGVSNPLISQIETGKVKSPGFQNMVMIAWALGLPVERLAACVRPPLSAIKR